MVREVEKRHGELDCHGVPGSRLCGDAAGVREAVGVRLISESPGRFETVPTTTTENHCHGS